MALTFLLPALVGGPATAQTEEHVIVGVGSSYPEPALNQWANDLYGADAEQLLVDYTPVGSKAGRDDWLAGEADFAVTDLPFNADEAAKAAESGKEYAYAPIAAGALVFSFNLLDQNRNRIKNINLSPLTLAMIFTGRIQNWTDEKITEDNGGTALPVRSPGNVQTFVRSDTNGTSWALSSWIKAMAPEEWTRFTKQYNLPDAPVEKWPAQVQAFSGGSPDVVAQRLASADVLMISYLPPPYSTSSPNLGVVSVKNKAGNFVKPTPESTAKGLVAATVDPGTHLMTPAYDAADPEAYPLTMASYIVAPLNKTRPEVQTRLAKYLQYTLDHQDVATAKGYAPLSTALSDGTKDVIANLQEAAGTATTTTTAGQATTTTTIAATATTTSSSTTTTTAPAATTTTLRATASGGRSNTGLGATLADTGPATLRWLLPLSLCAVLAGEAVRRRRRA